MKNFFTPLFAVALLSLNLHVSTSKSHNSFVIIGSAFAGTISCNGGTTTVTATAAGGTGNMTYNLSGIPAAGGTYSVTSTPQTNGGTYNFVGVPAGTYSVTATADNGESANFGSFTITQPPSSGTNNGAPDLLLTSLITPSGSFPTQGSSIVITYTISNKNTTAITAQNLVLRVTRPYAGFTIELSPTSTNWQKTANPTGYAEFMMNPGGQIPCSSSTQVSIVVTRSGNSPQSPGVPITGIVYFTTGGPQDMNDFDNARASQVRIQ